MKNGIQRWLFKAMMVLFIVELSLYLIADMLRSVSTLHLVVAGGMVSLVAFFVRFVVCLTDLAR